MNAKLKTKLWISLILITLAIGGGLASYIGSEDTLFKGLFSTGAPTTQQRMEIGSAPSNLSTTSRVSTQNLAGQGAQVGITDLTETPISASDTRSISTQIPTGQEAARGGTLEHLDCTDYTNERDCSSRSGCKWVSERMQNMVRLVCRPVTATETPPAESQTGTVIISPDPNFTNREISPEETGTVASFIFENQSRNEVHISSVKFRKDILGFLNSSPLENSKIGNVRLVKNDTEIIGSSAEIRTDNTIQWPNGSGGLTFVPTAHAIANSLFSINARGTVKISLRATIAEDAEPGKKIRFSIVDGTYVATSSSVMISSGGWPVRSATITIGAAEDAAEEEPEELPTLAVSLAADSLPSASIAVTQWFDAAKFSFATEGGLVRINSININAKSGLDNALGLNKIDKIKLCIGIPSRPDFCNLESAEYAFNPSGTNVSLIFDGDPWALGFNPVGTVTIKAKLKNDAESGKRFALGINSANSITLATPGSANISGVFPIWGNEMTVAAAPLAPGGGAVTPRACRNGQYNNGGPDGGICVCPTGRHEYAGGATGTAYSPSVCIPCTSEELASTGGYYCPADLPARVTLPTQVFCNELQVSPASFFPFVARQTFTSVVNPTNFTGVVVWRHWKGDEVIESANGREATFNNINVESIITADAFPAAAAGSACHKQIEPGENLVSSAPQGSGAENWTEGEGALDEEGVMRGEEVRESAERPEEEAVQSPGTNMAALDLSETQRLRRAPERSETGPEILVYFGILAAVHGGMILKRKLKKKS